MINLELAHENSYFEHRSETNTNYGEHVSCPQPSVSQEEEEIQNSSFEHELS